MRGTIDQLLVTVPIDDELVEGLAEARPAEPKPGETVLDAERRRRADFQRAQRRSHAGVNAIDSTVAGIRTRAYRPPHPLGELLWIHGGGWAYGDVDTDATLCARIAAEAGVTVTTLSYRLAPEHPYPAALEDVVSVYRALRAGSEAPLFVAGASAGGALTAGLALQLKATAEPQPGAQLLICPALEATGTDEDTGPLQRDDLNGLWKLYLQDTDTDGIASPADAVDLTGLAPTYVFTTSADPVRLEGWRWAMRLAAAGVEVEARFLPGGYHGFEYEQPDAAFSHRAVSEWIAVIRRVLADANVTAPTV